MHSSPRPPTADNIIEAATGRKPRQWLTVRKPSEIIAYDPPEDFILLGDCHLTRGGISVLGGWPGVGKSRAALALAIAGATGKPWLGHKVHARFRTLILQVENGEFRLKTELAEAFEPHPEINKDDWLRITPPPPYGLAFHEPAFREALQEVVREFRPGLIIIDPWNRVAEGDKQADYRHALDHILECLPADPAEKPAILILHHMRKKGGDHHRKHGRDLLHELAGSYQIGSAARCVFVLEPASHDTAETAVVLTCCKNNDGREGEPTAWIRSNGLFPAAQDFDMEAFLSEAPASGRTVSPAAVARALHGMAGETKSGAVARLVDGKVCGKSKAYAILRDHPNITEDDKGKLWWKEENQ